MPCLLFLLLLLFYTRLSLQQPKEDKISALPKMGFNLTFQLYAGYLKTSRPGHTVYYMLQQSEQNKVSDPLIVVLKGGPGCAASSEAFNGMGAFKLGTKADGDIIVIGSNKNRWNKAANLLFFDSPPGTGFSTVEDGNLTTSDEQATEDNFQALWNFFEKFPYLQKNPLYIFGSSYSGLLAIMLANKASHVMQPAGVVLADSVLDFRLHLSSALYFLRFHGLMDIAQWAELVKSCCSNIKSTDICDFYTNADTLGTICLQEYNKAFKDTIGYGINAFYMYEDCNGGANPDGEAIPKMGGDNTNRRDNIAVLCESGFNKPSILDSYMNTKETRTSLHVKPTAPKWTLCQPSFATLALYERQFSTMIPHMKKLLKAGIKILMYNGDGDIITPITGTEWIADELGQNVTAPYIPWYYVDDDGLHQVGGFVQEYELLTFATIRGAGHTPVTYQPAAVSKLVFNFVHSLEP